MFRVWKSIYCKLRNCKVRKRNNKWRNCCRFLRLMKCSKIKWNSLHNTLILFSFHWKVAKIQKDDFFFKTCWIPSLLQKKSTLTLRQNSSEAENISNQIIYYFYKSIEEKGDHINLLILRPRRLLCRKTC